ncbi:MAG: preprotein translocase subunit SecG [Phycisphaerae bacterium]|jgi:protein translocase SecG subunit
MNPLAATWGQIAITFFFAVICILLILIILLQKGRGGGLAGAFGGAGGYSAFGAKTGDVFTWITVALTGLFVLVAIIGNYVFVPGKIPQQPRIVQPAGGEQPPATNPS